MDVIEEIRQALIVAEQEDCKMATFHAKVLIYAEVLKDINPSEFCKSVEVPDSYRTEFQKMLALRRTLHDLGYSVTQI